MEVTGQLHTPAALSLEKKPRHGQRNLLSTGENRFSDKSSG